MFPWKTIKKGDYKYAKLPNHPNATKNGYVLEHRAVVECAIGRFLTKSEVVHHINEDKHDNRLENLEVMSWEDHSRLHHKTGRAMVWFVCPICGIEFAKEKRQVKPGKTHNCSRSCGGKAARAKQLSKK